MIARVRMHIAFSQTSVEFLKLSLYACLWTFSGGGAKASVNSSAVKVGAIKQYQVLKHMSRTLKTSSLIKCSLDVCGLTYLKPFKLLQ